MFHSFTRPASWSLICLAAGLGANASLWPTRPIADTVFRAGRSEELTWIDNGKSPSLQDTGALRVELWNNQTFLYTLSTGVDPTKKEEHVTISDSLDCDGQHFHIRFISQIPRQIIYTADFTISSNGTGNFDDNAAAANIAGNPSATGATPTSASLPLALAETIPPESQTSEEWTTVTLTQSQALDDAAATAESTPGALSASSAAGSRRTQVERAQFRFVFVLWPVLVGVALAL